MSRPAHGEIWWSEDPALGRRPVLVVTRPWAVEALRTLVVAPVTRTVRNVPTELALGADDGLALACVASFDNLTAMPRSHLIEHAGTLSAGRTHELCAALAAVADC